MKYRSPGVTNSPSVDMITLIQMTMTMYTVCVFLGAHNGT